MKDTQSSLLVLILRLYKTGFSMYKEVVGDNMAWDRDGLKNLEGSVGHCWEL